MTKIESSKARLPANEGTLAAAPFGTVPRRSRWPFIAMWMLYGLWLAFLIYLAACTVGK